MSVTRHVKGVLFADYARMMRSQKRVDWSRYLPEEDLRWLSIRIDPDGWYPMESFERMGNGILHEIASSDLETVRAWGRFSLDQLRATTPGLVAPGDPVESLMRFRVLRSTFFDFEALEIPTLNDVQAEVIIHYYMGPVAEEAASYQTRGFFERLLDLSGAMNIEARFTERSWTGEGDTRTVLLLDWQMRGKEAVRG